MSDARLPGGLPHLPVCGVCVQPGGSHGPDSLSHHPDQVFFPLHPWIHSGFSKSPTQYSHLCFSFRTVSPELKSYALGVLFLLLRLLGKNLFHQITHLYFIAQVWIMQHKTVIGDSITYLVLNAACTYGEKYEVFDICVTVGTLMVIVPSPRREHQRPNLSPSCFCGKMKNLSRLN